MFYNKRHLKRRTLVVVITTFLTGFLIASLVFERGGEDMDNYDLKYALQHYFPDEISCYFEEDIEDDYWKNFINKFKSTDVYFHWTSCRYTIKLANLCAIEAASRAYPHETVYVLFCKPLQFSTAQRKLLNNILEYLTSVKFVRVSVQNYFTETPFEKTIYGFLNSSQVKKHKRLEEALTIATLYRNGGIVVDTDVIVTKIPDISKDWLLREYKGSISSAILSFKTDKHSFIDGSVVLLDDIFKNNTLSSILTDKHAICTSNGGCKDIEVLDGDIVNVQYSDKAGEIPKAFAYRVVDTPYERRIPANSLLEVIAKKYCPFVYSQAHLFK